MPDELDMSTIFILHEIENGLNPEIKPGLYEKLLGNG